MNRFHSNLFLLWGSVLNNKTQLFFPTPSLVILLDKQMNDPSNLRIYELNSEVVIWRGPDYFHNLLLWHASGHQVSEGRSISLPRYCLHSHATQSQDQGRTISEIERLLSINTIMSLQLLYLHLFVISFLFFNINLLFNQGWNGLWF